jgi:hypothetical protein
MLAERSGTEEASVVTRVNDVAAGVVGVRPKTCWSQDGVPTRFSGLLADYTCGLGCCCGQGCAYGWVLSCWCGEGTRGAGWEMMPLKRGRVSRRT